MADYNITAVTRRVVYTGSAGVGPYAFTFPVISQTDIAVYKNSTKLTLTTNYTVTVSSANGTGSVTLVVAATGSDRITIIGARAIERTTDFVTAGDLKASSLNEQLDASIILIQQLAEENKRTLKAPQFDPAAVEDGGTLSMVLPTSTSRAGKTLAFDTDGNPVVGEDIGNWRGNWAAGVSYTVRDLVKDSSNSNVYRVNTAHTSSGTTPISSNADVAKFDLVIDAAAAAASAAAAAASASAAATSESNASTSASNASTSASNASTSASNASSAQTAAESARDATLAAYDSFDDRYLGSKTSDPTLDNDGNALVGGALYFNSVAGEMRIWTGSAWVAAYVSGAGFVAKAGDTMTGVLGLTAGTVSLPALTTTGDTNTGIFFPAADTIAFAEGGVEAMRIASDGNVTFTNTAVMSSSFLRNRIINGNIAVDQRNAGATQTFTAAAALAYSVDRWYGYCTGANVTGARVTGATANQYRYQFTGAASVTAIGFGQRIEALNSADLAGTTATLSVVLANTLLTTVTWTAYYANTTDTFGSLASPTVTSIATGTFTVTSTATQYSANISIPAAATTGIQILFTVGAQISGTWTIGNVQLEVGTVATPFERQIYNAQLAQCQRYFSITDSLVLTSAWTAIALQAFAPQEMRTSPTLTTTVSSGSGAVFSILGSTNRTFYLTTGNSAAAAAVIKASAEL